MPLAIGSYRKLAALRDSRELLNLAWTQDERELLTADISGALAEELGAEVTEGLPFVNAYLVQDPYGEGVLGPAVRTYFGLTGQASSVTCGAGVGPLLHALGQLAAGGVVEIATDVYPDFPHWVRQAGGTCAPYGSVDAPRVLLLERPALAEGRFDDLGEVARLCDEARCRGALVLIDESNGNYQPPEYSAVTLTTSVDNLIVVRGLSKAYGLGGLRLGYCVTSGAATESVRSRVPPLQPSSLSLRIGRRILALGDITRELRRRIATHQASALAVLHTCGLTAVSPSAGGTPYLLIPQGAEEALEQLSACGVQGKLHPVWRASTGGLTTVGRLSVPLTHDRMHAFERRLDAARSTEETGGGTVSPDR